MHDMSALAARPTGVLTLRHPKTNKPMVFDGKPATITLFGPGSKEHVAAKAKQSNRYLERMAEKGGTPEPLTAAGLAESQSELLADCTVSIDFPYSKGAGLTGRDLALAVYDDITIGFVATQAAAFIGDWGNFMDDSATS